MRAKGVIRTTGALSLALLTVVAFVLVLAAPALAHHPVISGEVLCDQESGSWLVVWEVANSETVAGSNRTMTIDAVTYNGPALTLIVVGAVVPPDQVIIEHQQVQQGVELTLIVRGDWDLGGSQDISRQATVQVPDEPCTSTTTTTTPTTVPPTTTPPTTTPPTTTPPTTTPPTTTPPTTTPPTTVPPTTVPPTTVPPTTVPPTVAPTSIVTTTQETLPVTGFSDSGVGGAGVALLLGGASLLLLARRRQRSADQPTSDWSAQID